MRHAAHVACALLFATATASIAQDAVEVTVDALNVRAAPMGTVLGQVGQGDRFVVSGQSQGWLRIDHAGRSAWISAAYTRRVAASGVRIAVDSLNMRTGPSTAYGVMAVAERGQAYVLLETTGEWDRVQVDRRTGWVAAFGVEDLDLGASAPAPSAPSSLAVTSSVVNATQADVEVLARIVKGEAAQCSFDGKVAVAAVVLNRVKANGFPGTIAGVAHQPYQFSCYNADVRDRLYWGPIPQSCMDAARAALAGQDPSRGATFYFNPYLVKPSWAHTMRFLVRIGTNATNMHDFYRP
jgi:uncharacterized protein YraI